VDIDEFPQHELPWGEGGLKKRTTKYLSSISSILPNAGLMPESQSRFFCQLFWATSANLTRGWSSQDFGPDGLKELVCELLSQGKAGRKRPLRLPKPRFAPIF
jgi:hypothetical protein